MSRLNRYNRLSDDATRRLCFDNPFVWEVARLLDYERRGEPGGRPNQYPLWVFFLWLLLIHEYGSSRKVEEAFDDVFHGPWPRIREAAQREFGTELAHLIPPEGPPSRNAFNYALKHHLPAKANLIAAQVRVHSRQIASAMGWAQPTPPDRSVAPIVTGSRLAT